MSNITERLLDRSDHYLPDWADQVMREAAVEIKQLREWKDSVLSKCKNSDGWDALSWGGDKSGWGFVHHYIGHLNTRALAAEAKLAALGDTHVVVRKDVDSAQSITRSKE